MKKLIAFAMAVTVLTIFNGCQKDELNSPSADEVQPQEVVKPDVYVENDYLVFKDYETYDSIAKMLNSKSIEFIKEFETELGFKSAFTCRQENMEKSNTMSEEELIPFLNSLSEEGYFNLQSQEFTVPFHNESRSYVLNPKGKVKIGNTFYLFEGNEETVVPDLSNKEYLEDTNKLPIKINLYGLEQELKSAEILYDSVTASGQQRLTMRIYRENEAIYGHIIVNGQIVWGLMGYHWTVNLRFHSWRQRALSKSDENTYFHWIANRFRIGGNDGLPYIDYSNPYAETSGWKAIHYEPIYVSTATPIIQEPNIYRINADYWSDRIPTPIRNVDYPE